MSRLAFALFPTMIRARVKEAGSATENPRSWLMAPSATNGAFWDCSLKLAIARPIVSSGVVVGNRVSALILPGPSPTMQMNLAPPASIPPQSVFSIHLLSVLHES